MRLSPFCGITCAALLLVVMAAIAYPAAALEVAVTEAQSCQTKPHVFAHRGGRKWAPENTLAAFRKCLDTGVYGIELDIHRCKSGELVVMHDENVKRTTNGAGLIKDMTLSDLQKLSAGSWYAKEFSDEKVPTLAEVLKLVDGKMVINIEIKNAPIGYPGIEDDLLALLKDYKYPDKIIISSFDHDVLWRIHQKSSRYSLALLTDGILYNLGSYAHHVGVNAWNPAFADVRGDNVAQAHSAGLQVGVWTPSTPEEWKSAVAMEVDDIITDDPQGLMAYLNK